LQSLLEVVWARRAYDADSLCFLSVAADDEGNVGQEQIWGGQQNGHRHKGMVSAGVISAVMATFKVCVPVVILFMIILQFAVEGASLCETCDMLECATRCENACVNAQVNVPLA
jgi:hypothetical protein